MDIIGQTSFETDPVESLSDALLAFVAAYDNLQMKIGETTSFGDDLKLTMYMPIQPDGENRPSISLYELGVVYFPRKGETGKYAVHRRKLEKALNTREDDVRALFIDGVLPRLCEMLSAFLDNEEPPEEEIYISALRFLNECRRLTAMLS